MGSRAGIVKAWARRLGLTEAEYLRRVAAGLKRCTRCKEWKPVGGFGADASRGDGLSATCNPCRYPTAADCPTKEERRRKAAAGLAWCRGCREWLPLAAIRSGLCRQHRNEDARRRYATDPRVRAERQQHAISRRRGVDPVPVDGGDYRLETFDGRCWFCGDPATTWDHLVAVSRGGKTQPNNIVPACGPCNSSKGDRDVLDWLESRGLPFCAAALEAILFLLEDQGVVP